MATPFTSTQKDLPAFFSSLSPEDVQDKIYSPTFYKGKEYYEDDRVQDPKYTYEKNRLTAQVMGSLDYKVIIELKEGTISANCNCPVGGFCKHITAVFLYAIHRNKEIELSENRGPGSKVEEHLNSLSKQELISLIMQYAPEEFFQEIKNLYASGSEAQGRFHKTAKSIRKLFQNDDLLYSPTDFSEALVKQINRLLGLEHQLQEELPELIFYIIGGVENAFDEGHLYDHYSDASFEPPEEFDLLVEQYLKTLPFTEKVKFLNRLDHTLEEASYTTFDSLGSLAKSVFSDSELPALKRYLLTEQENLPDSLLEKYYDLARPLLSAREKEGILHYLKFRGNEWILELAQLYREQEREKEAKELIKEWLSVHQETYYSPEKIYALYLDLLHSPEEIKNVCMEAIQRCARSGMLEKIVAVSHDDTGIYEGFLEQKNPQELLDYLEKNDRLPEALHLLKRSKNIWNNRRYEFFRKHKNTFPEEAVQYFSEVIETNLQHTGSSYYYTIAEALKQIRQVNQRQAKALADEIRTNYHRRRNLISLLSEF